MPGVGFIQDRLAPSRPAGLGLPRSVALVAGRLRAKRGLDERGALAAKLYGGGFPAVRENLSPAAGVVPLACCKTATLPCILAVQRLLVSLGTFALISRRCWTRPLRRNLSERKSPSNSLIRAGHLGFLSVITLGSWKSPDQSDTPPAALVSIRLGMAACKILRACHAAYLP